MWSGGRLPKVHNSADDNFRNSSKLSSSSGGNAGGANGHRGCAFGAATTAAACARLGPN